MSELAPGIYEELVTAGLQRRLQLADDDLVHREGLEAVDAEEALVRHLAAQARRALKIAGGKQANIDDQVRAANRISEAIASVVAEASSSDDQLAPSQDVLLAIAQSRQPDGRVTFPARPDVPLTSSALLVNGRNQPQIGGEVVKELASADRVDLLIAFVKWHGLRLIERALRDFLARGGVLRVITTTYMGATELRAVERLASMGAEVAISYDTHRTRLHAKAWLFHRNSGLDTAYVGSSNLSRAAMLDGVEWNVRLARAEQPHLVDTFAATFEEYWNDPGFERYDSSRDHDRLAKALAVEQGEPSDLPLQVANIDVVPRPYQQEVLDTLQAARENHGHWRNLVVMATGTGKTIVAALDYERLRKSRKVESLLFVAHRKEILTQSLSAFRAVLKDGSFGELLVDGQRPSQWQHVFASIQSLRQLPQLSPSQFDMVIVDEFHHAAANSYSELLDRVEPIALLGLTATPERTDGEGILHWFDGERPTAELRLWEALERGMLVPFHYFGIHDDVDLSDIPWRRGMGYNTTELTNLYTGLDTRVALIVQALEDKLGKLAGMTAVGFCVSIGHANYMADRFSQKGIPALAVTSAMTSLERISALKKLRSGEIKIIFTVDLFNEGVDVPDINTILFLRPTESATVFLQQLGRGLRLTNSKPVLTVLDFVGHQRKEFRFDKRFTALTGKRRGQLEGELNAGFPTLPAGSSIDLDREVSKIVLANIRQALNVRWKDLASELRAQTDASLRSFLKETGLELEDLYRGNRGGWAALRRDAGLEHRPVESADGDSQLRKAISRLLHVDDPERIDFLRELLKRPEPPSVAEASFRERVLLSMLNTAFDARKGLDSLDQHLARLWANPARREELLEVIEILHEKIHRLTPVLPEIPDRPLRLHARYSRGEALTAFGMEITGSMVAGVQWFPDVPADVFLVTINKSAKHFSPTTMYNDRAISQTLFQWESQGRTAEDSDTGQRYISHAARGSAVHLFLREDKEDPYDYAGPMRYVSHEGERPMRIVWELAHPLPAEVFHYAKVNTG
jgi:superfamily II DNA or RNA helicase